jgi:hypothetical protein
MKSRAMRAFLGFLFTISADGARAESSVWTVQGPSSTVYLAGACHALRPSDYPLPTEFDAAYRASSDVVFEAPLDELQKPEFAAKLMGLAVFDDGGTLETHLKPETYAKLDAFCKERNLPLEQMQVMRPWMLALSLVLPELQRLGFDPTNGVDVFFGGRARADGKSIGSFETVYEQLGFLTLIGKGMEDEMFIQLIDEMSTMKDEIPVLTKAWKAGDESALAKLLADDAKDDPRLHQALIVDRNIAWAGKIKEFFNRPGNTLVVVGVAHLVGDDSVVQLLRKEGFKVEKFDATP